MGVCHGADAVVWWMSGARMQGFDDDDYESVEAFLRPFGRFLYGEGVEWGTEGKGERGVREFAQDGLVRVVGEEDGAWEDGMSVWRCMLGAQL